MNIIPIPMPIQSNSNGTDWFDNIRAVIYMLAIIFVIDLFTGSHIARRLYTTSAPEYIIPERFQLAYNQNTGKYAIRIPNDEFGYMQWSAFGGFSFYSSANNADTFYDSSFAKGMLKKYVNKTNFK